MQVRKRAVHPLGSPQSFVASDCLLTAPAPPADGSSGRAVPDLPSVVLQFAGLPVTLLEYIIESVLVTEVTLDFSHFV